MGGGNIGGAPSLPLPILALVAVLLAVPMILALKSVQGYPARFVILAIWLRYIMSAFHEITFAPVVAGLSLNALGSVAIAGIGLLLVAPRHFLLKPLMPVYALILLSLISAAANDGLFTALNAAVKHIYFMVLMIAVYRALLENGGARFFAPLLWAFAPLLVFQLLSIGLGAVKASEFDGSSSYIGGYNHEATFSIAMATFFLVACFAVTLQRVIQLLLFAVLLGGIILANYRTTMLAVLPLAAIQVVSSTMFSFVREQRVILAIILSLLTLMGIAVLAGFSAERFNDLAVFFGDPGQYIKPQAEFSFDERRLLSGRLYIWSGYLYAWLDGSTLNHLIGFGPDSWEELFKVYPHNTIVAYLYELGWAGVFLLIIFWISMAKLAMRAPVEDRATLIFAHLSFLFMNLSTMAMWQIEGVIFYAILCGFSLFRKVETGAIRSQLKPSLRPV
ncbi:O-antigen ligase family protein [Parasphingorhabdus sp.]|uniref:O-antigen ligase family protein n=1 Tax=Parasphingorhabdus sp. TaxID=2709688 RepID=UPI003BB1FD71